jgi:glucose-1-phosphate thymidylyltransferase
MKVIIPLAGKGTRLRPHTHVVPKPMLRVAGQPVMSYILDDLRKLGNVEQVIYITGHLKE